MKSTYAVFAGLAASLFLMVITSCEKENEGDEKITSSFGSESHNSGKNCLSCHEKGGAGEGVFQVAGTVYNNAGNALYSRATVQLTTGSNGSGTLVASLQSDQMGNFYTSSAIDFSGGLYVRVLNQEGTAAAMMSPVNSGACNNCHSGSSSRIAVP